MIFDLIFVSEVRFRKTRLLHLGNVEKPPHPQFFAQRAPEGEISSKKHTRALSVESWITQSHNESKAPSKATGKHR